MRSLIPEGSIDVPQLPVVDLITGRQGSTESQVTEDNIYYAQYNWRALKLYRLDPDRRKEICSLLVSLTKKLAPDLVQSDAFSLWEKVAKNPTYIDFVFGAKDEE